MTLLLDTHALLWWLADDPSLSQLARKAIADPNNLVLYSAASIWEISIKRSLDKIRVPKDFEAGLAAEPLASLAVTAAHALQVARLPPHHRDPFDRMLVAQCQVEKLLLVTRDPDIKKYDLSILEA